MNQFRKFMYGRYGIDQFSQVLIFTALILSVLVSIFRINVLMIITYIPLVYAVLRMLSKDINKRTQENYKFLNIVSSFKTKYNKSKPNMKETKTYKYYKCPKCKQMIRVPRNKGKICITCPKCKTEFTKRT